MHYGKKLREEIERSFPDWKRQFMSYKKLKKQLNLINSTNSSNWPRFATTKFFEVNNKRICIGFTRLLDNEFNKVNRFYFDKEEDYIIRLKELQVRVANLASDEEKLQVQKDILSFHGEMVLLLHYTVLNFTGLVKIVKKHNRRTGTNFQFSSLPRVMRQPFFCTDLLYKLMKECEALLASLFLSGDDHF